MFCRQMLGNMGRPAEALGRPGKATVEWKGRGCFGVKDPGDSYFTVGSLGENVCVCVGGESTGVTCKWRSHNVARCNTIIVSQVPKHLNCEHITAEHCNGWKFINGMGINRGLPIFPNVLGLRT